MRKNISREVAAQKARELLGKLTLVEKIGQLSQFGTSIYNNKLNIYEDRLKEGKLGSYLTVNGAKLTNEIQKTALNLYPQDGVRSTKSFRAASSQLQPECGKFPNSHGNLQ
jgi:hypothetical protein